MSMKLPGGVHEKIAAAVPPSTGVVVAGGTKTLGPNVTATLAELTSLEEQAWTILTGATACVGGGADAATRARHQIMMRISSGTAKGTHTDLVPAGKKVVVVGSSVRVDAFMRRTDGNALVATLTSQVSAFIASGSTDAEAYPSQWIEPAIAGGDSDATYEGQISAVPCTLKSVYAVNLGTVEGTLVLLDQGPFGGGVDADLHNAPKLFVVPVPAGGYASFDLPRGRCTTQGLVWGISSTRAAFALDPTQLFRVDAEIGFV